MNGTTMHQRARAAGIRDPEVRIRLAREDDGNGETWDARLVSTRYESEVDEAVAIRGVYMAAEGSSPTAAFDALAVLFDAACPSEARS